MTTEFNAYHQELSNAQGWTIIEDLTPDAPNLGEKKYLLQNHDSATPAQLAVRTLAPVQSPALSAVTMPRKLITRHVRKNAGLSM